MAKKVASKRQAPKNKATKVVTHKTTKIVRESELVGEKKDRFRFRNKSTSRKKRFLPGYVTFTKEVYATIRTNRRLLLRLVGLAWLVSLVMFGATQQAEYSDLKDSVTSLVDGAEGFNKLSLSAGALFLSVSSGGLNGTLSESQQIYIGLMYLLLWLVTVWLLRYLFSGSQVKLRDAIYSSGAPLVSTILITLFGILQLLPAAIGTTIYSAVVTSGVVTGIGTLPFLLVAFASIVLSLYWLTSTLFALIIVTVPGTYPVAALRSAKKLVKGYRSMILFRVAWMLALVFIYALILLIPAILIDTVLKLSRLPVVLLVSQFVAVSALVFITTYLYMLYRKVIDGTTA